MKKISFLIGLGIIALIFSQYLIFFYAPLEKTMGYAQKIFYYHLPVAIWSFISFFISFVAAIIYLKSRKEFYDKLSATSAEIGFLLASLTLVSGMIWGKYAWGVWWTWDPRLTTALVLWFIYAAYLVFRTMPMPTEKRNSVCAVISIIGFLDVPLVFLSARLWRSIHPAVFGSEGGGLEPEMAHTVLFCIFSFAFIYFSLLLIRLKQLQYAEIIKQYQTKILYDEMD